MKTLALTCILLSLTSCAATSAYLQTHPDAADDVAIVAAAEECLDSAAASIILEDSWQTILENALACAAGKFSGLALQKTEIAINEKLQDRLARRARTLKAAGVAAEAGLSFPPLTVPKVVETPAHPGAKDADFGPRTALEDDELVPAWSCR